MTAMKKFRILTVFVFTAILLSSCFEDREVLWEGKQIEFEDAVMRARATGQIFPIINLTRTSGSPTYQINLIGEQLGLGEDITFSLDEVPASLLTGTTIAAVEGTHFTLNAGGAITFPEAASTTLAAPFTVDNAFTSVPGASALFIIKLDGNDRITPAENYRRLGFRISLN
jgi:hypothetical protein